MEKSVEKRAHGELQTLQLDMPPCKFAFQDRTCGGLTKNQLEQVAHGMSHKTEQPSRFQLQSTDEKQESALDSQSTPLHSAMEQLPCAFQSRYVSVKLRRERLWKIFNKTGTEMILTKNGRRMFPILDFTLTGLDPDQYYTCAVELVRTDGCRYRYHAIRGWGKAGVSPIDDRQRNYYEHPNSASLGRLWMTKGACFDKLRLTNHLLPGSENILLGSMLKYHARFVLTKLTMGIGEQWNFDFPVTSFIAVTSYQNPQMTKLKIDNNPFAKAFRDGKRKTLSDSSSKMIKKRRTRFPSPPPITRYQSPFLAYLNRQDLPESTATLQPTGKQMLCPPTVPEYCPPNCNSIQNEPFQWEQSEPFNFYNTMPAASHNFSNNADTSYYKQEYHPHVGQQYQFDTHAPVEPEFPSCHMATQQNWYGGSYGLFEDVQLYPFDNFQWREN